jgi:hypothetical protein
LLLLLGVCIQGCEPCAIVLGGHCSDRQHDIDDAEQPLTCPASALPANLRPRGIRG